MISVAFICTANRCRSVMAHAILAALAKNRSLPIQVYSAGILDFSDQPQLDETSDTCRRHNTSAPVESPTWVAQLPLDSINEFLVMEQNHANVLTAKYGIAPDRIRLLGTFDPQQRGGEISDPFSLGDAAYDRSYGIIRECIGAYLESISQPESIR
jgi:protein-tyrosine phosphatase